MFMLDCKVLDQVSKSFWDFCIKNHYAKRKFCHFSKKVVASYQKLVTFSLNKIVQNHQNQQLMFSKENLLTFKSQMPNDCSYIDHHVKI